MIEGGVEILKNKYTYGNKKEETRECGNWMVLTKMLSGSDAQVAAQKIQISRGSVSTL